MFGNNNKQDLPNNSIQSILNIDEKETPACQVDHELGATIDKVVSLEEELIEVKNYNLNPKDIYLKHCQ